MRAFAAAAHEAERSGARFPLQAGETRDLGDVRRIEAAGDLGHPQRQRQQIGVAGYYQIRMAVDGQLQKFVVLRIATGGDALTDRDPFGPGQHLRQALTKGGDRYRCDVRPLQDAQDLLLGRGGFEKAAMVIDPADDEERRGVGFEDGAYEDVGIDDKPHPRRGGTWLRA